MDRLDAMSLFVAAIEEGSLAAAARRRGRSPAAATRAVTFLEGLAGEILLLRSTRRLRLTPAGERHVAIWKEVLAKLSEVDPGAPEGPVGGSIVVTAPELFGRSTVLPVIESFLESHPQVGARLLMLNRVVDLVGEGVNLAVRLAPLPDSMFTAIRLGELRRLVCASPEYLARSGEPETPNALEEHQCIGLNAQGDQEQWAFRMPQTDRVRSVRVATRLSLNSAGAAIDAAVRGRGIIRPMSYQVADDLASGRLVRLLIDFEPSPTPVQLVFRPEQAQRGAMRLFIDHSVPLLRGELARMSQAILTATMP
ncbi:LysR family transcriptional regulator [Sphingomonas sp. UV9]|uniref:LysR substrate-binding domain-containing protein n=1 Tax=Sphingomonas sp. UV9 TaxID=1851410 RepID=UPI000FFB63E2|nr:LysR substrate-binding domain-containing protein [Sphingomonas sp. UV9]RXD04842.1 LysR family transcriptional regulator [Sphingomonas sp. UV9]